MHYGSCFSTKKETSINGDTYYQYDLVGALTDNGPDDYKQGINVIVIQVIRGGKTFNGDVYFDDIVLYKSRTSTPTAPDDNPPDEGGSTDSEIITLSDSKTISVTDANVNTWPNEQFDISTSGKIYSETTVAYDVTIEDKTFNSIYLETDFNWNPINTITLTPNDFKDGNRTRITVTFIGEPIDNLWGLQIKTDGSKMDYRGDITCSNVTITRGKEVQGEGDAEGLEHTVLFSGGKEMGTNQGVLYENTGFNMNRVMPGGYFYVEYEAAKKATLKLTFNSWHVPSVGWKEMATTASGEVESDTGKYYAKISYRACENAVGAANRSSINAVGIKMIVNADEAGDQTIKLTSFEWIGPKYTQPSIGGGTYDGGSNNTTSDAPKEDKKNTNSTDSAAPAVEQNKSETVGGQDFFVTKSSAGGSAEVAFVETPATTKNTVIPDTVTINGTECKVVTVAAEAFKGDTKIETMKVGGNVVRICDEAFAKCTSLKKVTISNSVTSIGMEAFSGCKNLKKIVITSKGLKKIGKNALKGVNKNAVIEVPKGTLKAYKKLFTAKTGFKKTMKIVEV